MMAWSLALALLAVPLAFVLIQYQAVSFPVALGRAGIALVALSPILSRLGGPGTVAAGAVGGLASLAWYFRIRGLGEDGTVLRHGAGTEVCLTFDDGPDAATTPRILDILRGHRATATFFVVGDKAARHPDLVRRMHAEGHTVGLHGFVHRPYPWLSPARLRADLDQQCALLQDLLGCPPRWIRPPWGLHHRMLRQEARRRGLRLALWTRSTRDWTCPGEAVIADRIVAGAQPGAVLLLHDASHDGRRSAIQTVAALDLALEELSRRGVRCQALRERGPAPA
jgi:peptidoglycan/xylan/chitin deacetylase (PgdA/CDA1 family)